MAHNNTDLQKNISKLMNPNLLLRLIAITVILEFSSLALGFAFFLIVHGLIFGVLWFMFYWEPAYRIYTRILQLPPTQFVRAPIPWWRIGLLGVKAIIILFFLYLGMRILISNGFLGQNLIYAIFKSS
jgi:hypothetical protein